MAHQLSTTLLDFVIKSIKTKMNITKLHSSNEHIRISSIYIEDR
jgi:hypothetical protein